MKHILFDLKDCLMNSPLNDEEYIRETLIEAAKIGKLEVLKIDTHKFEPYGVTGYALLAESHIVYTHGLKIMLLDVIYFHAIQTLIINL